MIANLHFRERASRHLALILISSWLVFVYRDVWPLMTYTLKPADTNEGIALWLKIIILTIVAILVPGFMPQQYVPLDFQVCSGNCIE